MFVENAVRRAGVCFDHGIPAIVSLHSINFHSSVSGFRQRTVRLLDQFLSALQSRHANLLYLDDDDLYHLVTNGFYQGSQGTTRVKVTRKRFTRGEIEQSEKAG